MTMTINELEPIMARCIAEEFTIFISHIPGAGKGNRIGVSLEKGSSYGAMHMKFTASGDTVSEAFEKCLRNFPANPIGASWDTQRLAPPTPSAEQPHEDGLFTEVPPEQPKDVHDGIPF